MEAIFSSKLYKTSRRKDKIASALANPVNMELVQQLKSYLEPEEKEDQAFDDSKKLAPKVEAPGAEKPEDADVAPTASDIPSAPSRPAPRGSAPADFDAPSVDLPDVPTSEVVPDASEDSEPAATAPEKKESTPNVPMNRFHAPQKKEAEDKPVPETEPTEPKEEAPVEESTQINAATTLYQPPVQASCCDQLRVDAAAIKGTLNVRDDTKGVARILEKDKELWIYYQDNVNLNTVMEPVIAVLNSTGFTNLEFNRLARSANAIVFDISCIYEDVKPIAEEEKK